MKFQRIAMLSMVVFSLILTSPLFAQTDVLLQNNIPIANISGSAGGERYYKILLPSGQSFLDIKTSGGTGDCDLYVKLGSHATTSSYNARSISGSNNEIVKINNPASGTWYVTLRGYTAYSGLSLVAAYGVNNLTVRPNQLSYQPGNTILFSGQLKTSTGQPVFGTRIGIDDPVGMVCTLGPITDSNGRFTYQRILPPSAKGVYAFTFYGGSKPVFAAIVVNSPRTLNLQNSLDKIPLGTTNSVSSIDLAISNKMANTSGLPKATQDQLRNKVDKILSFMVDGGRNSIVDFISNPANDLVVLEALACTGVTIWSGGGTILCTPLYGFVVKGIVISGIYGYGTAWIDKTSMSYSEKTNWKNWLKSGKCVAGIVLFDPQNALVSSMSVLSTGWTCGSVISVVSTDSKNRKALKLIASPPASSSNQTVAGLVLIEK